LSLLRACIRKKDKLSINGPGIITVVIRAEQSGAEIVAQRIKKVIENSNVTVGLHKRGVKATVTYSLLAFHKGFPQGESGQMGV
jgi:hypothetical protein